MNVCTYERRSLNQPSMVDSDILEQKHLPLIFIVGRLTAPSGSMIKLNNCCKENTVFCLWTEQYRGILRGLEYTLQPWERVVEEIPCFFA